MAKRKFVEELSDEELSKVVENIQSIMVNEMSDEELLKAVKRIESPLFEFESRTVGPRKRWKKNVMVKQLFTARLKELRQLSPDDNVGVSMTHALERAIAQQIQNQLDIQPHHTLHFNMQAEGYTHAFQSTTFSVKEFQQSSERMQTYLQSLVNKLNSGEEFNTSTNFETELTLICTPPASSGRGKERSVGRRNVEAFLKAKRGVIKIKNTDELCCARAIVTMKARLHKGDNVDGRHLYKNLRDGYPVQGIQAKELHSLAGVPEGPCGLQELEMFQKALSPEYQIVVLTVDKPHMITYKGQPTADKKILLIQVDQHYHGCTSYGGFLNKSYFCFDCEKGFDHDDLARHPCQGRKCTACHRKDCPDYVRHKTPELTCDKCHRDFFGTDCYRDHKKSSDKDKKTMCDIFTKCTECCKIIEHPRNKKNKGGKKHQCGVTQCPVCQKRRRYQNPEMSHSTCGRRGTTSTL